MKIHRTKKLKSISALALVICAGLYWYFKEVGTILFHYIWPMHLVVMVIGGIMVFGMMNDQKIIEKAFDARFGGRGILSRVRNRALSSICMIPLSLITMLPAFFIIEDFVINGVDQGGDGFAFVQGWLIFSIISGMYFLVAQPILNYGFLRITNKELQDHG